MANQTCVNSLKVCAIRVLRLDDDGTVLSGASSMYVWEAPIQLTYTEVRPDRETLTMTDGCGTECGLYRGPARGVSSVDMGMQLCNLDAELMELLCGGSVITNGSYGTIGYKPADDSTINENGVAVETWSIAWAKNQRKIYLGNAGWWRHTFPKTSWSRDQHTMENDFANIALTGVGEVNSGFDTGLVADPIPVAVGDVPYLYFLDDAKPSGECGYQVVA